MYDKFFIKSKAASKSLSLIGDDQRNALLLDLARKLRLSKDSLIKANALDLEKMDPSNPLYDRLQLSDSRLDSIASDIENVAHLHSPTGETIEERILANGLKLKKIRVPFGVIGVVYEARPNVTFDVFSLCFKTGNACVLKGGKDADNSNRFIVELIQDVLSSHNLPVESVQLLPSTHDATAAMLSAVGMVDLVIPRGGRRLIDFVRDNAKVPCIETGAGVVNCYFDSYGDLEMGKAIVNNAKTRRVSVCNALDCLIVHENRLSDLAQLCMPLACKNVTIYADDKAYFALQGKYPYLEKADESSYGTEFMDYKMAIKTVQSIDKAIAHIDRYGSGHSECIITENDECASLFQSRVDAACVYVNAPTSFTDGAQFGLGAEIGISTQKLGARGPMGLEEITSYKWLITGKGQIRN